ncbi:MAG: transglycosylase domain-containing protein [Actinobacteria bacterium]|nr:transglycosylase domain-containing protein [Actinomycetota bacterium]
MPAKRPPPRHAARRPAPRKPRTRKPTGKRRSFVWRYRRLLFLLGLLVFTGLAGAGYLLVRVPLPPEKMQAQTSFLTDADGDRLALLTSDTNRVNVKLADVPPVVIDAVLATEDKNFFDHSGLDPFGVLRATVADLRGSASLQGGSTITQQYVKNVYLGSDRTLARKVKEAALAVKVERKLDKQVILERYLNTIYFGRGAYGVQAASRAYFGKDVGALDLREAAYLAGLIRAPVGADALKNPKLAARRRDSTLRSMERARSITREEREAVAAMPVESYVIPKDEAEPTFALPDKGTQYFVEYVRRQLVAKYGEATVLGGGLRVKTSLDLDMQAAAYDAVYGFLNRKDDPAGALVAIDDNGFVRAMVGGKDWTQSQVNLALGSDGGGSGRQPGSTFKPFVLAEAVRQGFSVQSSLPAPAEIVFPKANQGRDYPVGNYEDQDFGGSLNLIDATKSSVNTVYAQLIDVVGPQKVADLAHQAGVESDLEPGLSLTLGTSEVSVLEMASSYTTFANRGERVPPTVILEVTTADGRVLERARPERTKVLERRHADIVTYCLRQVVEGGSGTGAQFGKPLAGKTGTTDDFGDAWFVGYTPKLTAAVWMGYPEGNSRKMLNVRGRKVNGGSFPTTIFKRFMEKATAGMDTGSFPNVTSFGGKTLKPSSRAVIPTTTTTTSSTVPDQAPTTTTAPGGKAATTTTTTKPAGAATTTSSTTTTTKPPPTTSTTKKDADT